MSASAIVSGLRTGEIELARDLSPQDLEAILREPRLRAGLVETPKKGTYFALFNSKSALGGNVALRRALAGVTRSQDFVWAALGRFAVPATGILPPGILGHDAGRRRPLLPRDEALALLERGRPDAARPAHGRRPPHPAGSPQGAHGGTLRHLERPRRRGPDHDGGHEGVPRRAGARKRGPPDRPLDGGLRGPRRLHVRPLPFGGGQHADGLLVARDGPTRRGGAYREPSRRPREPLPEVREPSPRERDSDPAVPRGGLPDRGPGCARRRASQQPAVHQLSRDREVGGAGGSRRARVGRRHPPRADRRRHTGHRSGLGWNLRAGRSDSTGLRDTDAGRRGRARRSVARLGGDPRGRRDALPLPPAAGRALSRRPRALRPRRPLLVRAPSPEGKIRAGSSSPRSAGPRVSSTARHRISRASTSSRPSSSSSSWKSRCRSSLSWCLTRASASFRRAPERSARAGGRVASGPGHTGSRASNPGRRLELERNPAYWRDGYPKNEGIVFRFGVPPEEDPLRVPRRPVLPRVGSPSDRRRSPAPGPALPRDVPREPQPRDVLRGLQRQHRASLPTRGRASRSPRGSTPPAS